MVMCGAYQHIKANAGLQDPSVSQVPTVHFKAPTLDLLTILLAQVSLLLDSPPCPAPPSLSLPPCPLTFCYSILSHRYPWPHLVCWSFLLALGIFRCLWIFSISLHFTCNKNLLLNRTMARSGHVDCFFTEPSHSH